MINVIWTYLLIWFFRNINQYVFHFRSALPKIALQKSAFSTDKSSKDKGVWERWIQAGETKWKIDQMRVLIGYVRGCKFKCSDSWDLYQWNKAGLGWFNKYDSGDCLHVWKKGCQHEIISFAGSFWLNTMLKDDAWQDDLQTQRSN